MGKLTKLDQEQMDNVIYDARTGDLDSLKAIFTDEVDPSVIPTIQDEFSKATPFHMAAANGHTEVITYLLSLLDKKQALKAMSQRNESGNTPLHWACYNGHLETIKVLCKAGSDPYAQNDFKLDCLDEAENNDHADCFKYLLDNYGDELAKMKKEKVDEKKVKYSAGTEIQKIEEGGEDEHEDKGKDVEFLKTKTESLHI